MLGWRRSKESRLRAGDLLHVDMSRNVGGVSYCDDPAPPPSIAFLVDHVGQAPAGRYSRGAALVRIVAILAPRWDTPDGSRPNQDVSNAMAVPVGVVTPIKLSVTQKYGGSLGGATLTAFAPSGQVMSKEFGTERFMGCAFPAPSGLPLRAGGHAQVGGDYVALFGPEVLTGRAGGTIDQPLLDDLFEVDGQEARGPDGPEPLPRIASPPPGP
ncbi:MAG: hypothetical protein ABR532_00215 [Candidatus Dormibacteria bacterium]